LVIVEQRRPDRAGENRSRASFVSGLVVVAWVDTALLILAAALTFLLPRRAAWPASRPRASGWPVGAGG
jgi:hypothetical protein